MNTINRALLVVVLVAAASARDAGAGVPGTVNFTARLVENGMPKEGTVSLQLEMYDSASAGSSVWSETQSAMASQGLVALSLGASTPFGTSVFDGRPLFLSITVNGTTLSPRLPIASVPYAVMAERAERAAKLGDLAEGDVQRRVSSACPSGQAMSGIDAQGVPTCVATQQYTFTGGLTEANGVASADFTQVQHRIVGCPAGSSIQSVDGSGMPTCEVDDNSTYSAVAGSGITLTSNQFALRTCSTGSVLKATATGYSCASDDTGVQTVTATGGITGSVSGTALTLNTDTTIQRRSGAMTCPTGKYLRTINQDGSVTCASALSCTLVLGTTTTSTASASCASGSIVMGGGCSSPSNTAILDTYPSSTTAWACRTSSGSSVQARAICCDISN